MIRPTTSLIAHIGHPTHAFKSPLIYNPYFEAAGIDAVVMPMSCRAPSYEPFLRTTLALDNALGALVTMPHKAVTVGLLDVASRAVRVAGACNAVRRGADGALEGDLFDGEGFVRGARRNGFDPAGARALVVGAGGVGSAIAASLAAAGVDALALSDVRAGSAAALGRRLRERYPELDVREAGADPDGFDLVVNATPMGMTDADPLPVDVSRIDPNAFVGEVVMSREMTPFLERVAERGCRFQVGTDMLFEMIPAYLEFFGLPTTTPEALRAGARLDGAGTDAGGPSGVAPSA